MIPASVPEAGAIGRFCRGLPICNCVQWFDVNHVTNDDDECTQNPFHIIPHHLGEPNCSPNRLSTFNNISIFYSNSQITTSLQLARLVEAGHIKKTNNIIVS